MSAKAYYNEIDPFAAAWLRELIKAGHIAPGEVDERSIVDVRPDDLRGFTQCHFFAGIGVWSYALRRAGWADSRPVWTGSCPCQPFSAAGKGGGFNDERHLWPAFHWLISQCRPAIVLGEQVASKAVDEWVDLVQADVEALGYAFGAVPFPSAGVGAPHIRDRTFWLANASGARLEGQDTREVGHECAPSERSVGIGWLEHASSDGRIERRPESSGRRAAGGRIDGRVADAAGQGWRSERQDRDAANGDQAVRAGEAQSGRCDAIGGPGPVNGIWRDADWLYCRDGKWRPVEPGTFPLAHGAPARVGRLRGYGNAINAEAAVAFIEACK